MASLPELVVNMDITDLVSALLINGCNGILPQQDLERGIRQASSGFPSLQRRLFAKKEGTPALEAALQTLRRDYDLQFSSGSNVCLPEEAVVQLGQQLQKRYGERIFQQVDYFSREIRKYARKG